jgi:hypothetical protein
METQEICLANLHTKTAQEVFNYVARHLLTQNKKAALSLHSTSCRYLTTDGLRCAAGCLIAPSEYKEEFEGNSWPALVRELKVPNTHCHLIGILQVTHDNYSPKDWLTQLNCVAKRFNLKPVESTPNGSTS